MADRIPILLVLLAGVGTLMLAIDTIIHRTTQASIILFMGLGFFLILVRMWIAIDNYKEGRGRG